MSATNNLKYFILLPNIGNIFNFVYLKNRNLSAIAGEIILNLSKTEDINE